MSLSSAKATLFLTAALLSAGTAANGATISVQLVNPEPATAIRMLLDEKVIFEGKPRSSPNVDHPALPTVIGTFQSAVSGRHKLTVETVRSPGTKARLEWNSDALVGPWIVVRYYPGGGSDLEPPFFTLSLQKSAAANK